MSSAVDSELQNDKCNHHKKNLARIIARALGDLAKYKKELEATKKELVNHGQT